jgi:hypothetical protein
MTEDEAMALLAALDAQFSRPSADAWTLRRRHDVEGYVEEAKPDRSWDVVLRWRQAQDRFGVRMGTVKDVEAATPEQAAITLRLLDVEELHETSGSRDVDGRMWLSGLNEQPLMCAAPEPRSSGGRRRCRRRRRAESRHFRNTPHCRARVSTSVVRSLDGGRRQRPHGLALAQEPLRVCLLDVDPLT